LCIEIGRRRTENGHLTARVNYLESTQCTVDKEGKCARGERMAANAAELAQRMAREVDRLRTELADKDELIREAEKALHSLMTYPDIRTYVGNLIFNGAEATLARLRENEGPKAEDAAHGKEGL
jgi:hypothetical protein